MSYLNCERCGSAMIPLFTSLFCPRCEDGSKDCNPFDPVRTSCPNATCGSTEIEPFPIPDRPNAWHCWKCGDVW